MGAPHIAEDGLAGEGTALPLHQKGQQVELPGGEWNVGAPAPHLAARQVDLHIPEPYPLSGCTPAQAHPDPSEQLRHGEGLGHIVISPQAQPHHLVELGSLGREHDDGHVVAALPQGLQHLEAVDVGQHDVQDHQVQVPLADRLEGRPTIGGSDCLVAVQLEVHLQSAEDRVVVLDDQDALAHGCLAGVI